MRLHTSVMLRPDIRAKIDEIAAREGRSRSQMTERALEAWAAVQEQEPGRTPEPQHPRPEAA